MGNNRFTTARPSMLPLFYRPTALILLAMTVWSAASAHESDFNSSLSTLLLKQTQEFSEAGQANDTMKLARFLDDDVVFMNEKGEISSKVDLIKSDGSPPTIPVDRKIEVTDWKVHVQGGGQTATATFVDVLTQQFHGQTLVFRFLSMETWARRPTGWKMSASQTMNVHKDPPAITLPVEELDAYVGTYQVDATFAVTIARDAARLTASSNGQTPISIKAELRDVFFTPGAPNMRRIFQRDAAGHIVGYVSRRDGIDTVLSNIS